MLYKRPYIFFKGFCLDLTGFIRKHPGGSKVLQKYYYKDVTTILFTIYPHR
jgi:cytochrome b involved in lipid metabolism